MKNILILTTLTIILFLNCNSKNQNSLPFIPIGYFETPFTKQTGAPRQGILLDSAKGIIRMDTLYINGLMSLNTFEYIWVIYYFDQAKGWNNSVQPPESEHVYGVFATRSPRRPNPIGLSLVKLDSIKYNILYLSNIDAFDGTPVLDIKPYLPSIDSKISLKNMEAEIYLGHHDQNFLNDSLVKEFIEGKPKILNP